ncbi:3-deoxy-D-manno-octulosonic acid transferase [Thalassotalea insulae]|uniref:3-deoxy-D-manno-octulosonic acid transferase n=1 Tax=Thalassotalea insulae TaxID=2056778 RepID=A0ABQ6GSN4_9GAMM|nr:lipid IV(A) 3-deoxy-D-manno-octulosonic acid transferase [Thalassotalea insulae]GLX78397.1 3-deoxy-D-manno-octulosonic acid transferase [Thalassotalea insulae]
MHYFISLLLYRILLLLLLPVLIVVLLLRSINHPQYRYRIFERLGFVNSDFKIGGIVIHAASVGEVIALKSYIELLLQQAPELIITFTTFTPTGSAQVKKLFADRVQHCYLPLDIWPCSWLFLKALAPKAVVLMETELWPNLIAQCHQRGIILQLINGRLSDNSINSYRKLSWLIKPSLQSFQQILAQSSDNQKNFIALGADAEKCQVSGNLKYDLHISETVRKKALLLAQFIAKQRKIWLVASTHPGDEELVLASFAQLKVKYPELLLVLVPRHPERFESIYQLCLAQGFQSIKRSTERPVTSENDIWLIDSLGELLPLCGLADIVTMGGSFSSIGGHNPLEPALFKKPIVVGHDMKNFRAVMKQLTAKQGIMQLTTRDSYSRVQMTDALTQAVDQLLQQPQMMEQLGQQAFNVVQANQGASEYSVQALLALVKH